MTSRSSAAAIARATVAPAPARPAGSLAMAAIIKQPNGEPCFAADGTELKLGAYVKMVLSINTGGGGDAEEIIRQAVKKGILSQRVSEAESGEGFMRFSADDVKLIRGCLSGQSPLLIAGLIRLIDPEYYERLTR